MSGTITYPDVREITDRRQHTNEILLEVRNLKVHFPTADGLVKAVDGISFEIRRGETLGVVGESGSGKSVSFLTVMGLITSRQAQIEGEVIFKGRDLLKLPVEEMRHIRGKEMGMVFQDPMTSLHPMYRVGYQIAEAVRTHQAATKKEAHALAVEMLGKVGISKPAESARRYPHEFSGGMRQRAMIAMSLVLNPDLLIADEPTTALDVTVQAQILDLIDRLKSEFNAAVAIITHDLGVVAEHCDTHPGDVRRQDRGDRHQPRPVLPEPAPLHLGPAAVHPPPRRRGDPPPAAHQGAAAVADLRAAGMRLPSPLPLRHGPVPHRGPDPGHPDGLPRLCLPPHRDREGTHLHREA